MGRFLSLGLFLIVVTGLMMHLGMEIPYLGEWIGRLPGDLILTKGSVTLYIPFTSCALISAFISIVLSMLFSRS